ncbi:TIGR02391 family protein [Herbiconiux sp. VKM Ac-2851]|uniref:TIGR02391 family protein n=1 Tax=Herbiconiux sp. VKM Ac-2851 TaxID=2739025 RepID=UPI001562FEAE|nr:TIGR02391 family protein [Herbiconiux sp. VKM Ac-2851]NQX34733.1 TIGR02391 family protein [Herbiconiux sp. VKM Ac-2851]
MSTTPPTPKPPYELQLVQAVCDVLGQTEYPGLSGSEIDRLLQGIGLSGRPPGYNKREGLCVVLFNAQLKNGGLFIRFIHRAMEPVRYAKNHARFEDLRGQLSEVMTFYGFTINAEGKVAKSARAKTLSEGAKLSGRLHTELRHRGAHELLFEYCAEELINRSLFHALTEASKSIPSRVRKITGLAGDGAALYDGVFGTNTERPLWFINAFDSASDVSEHRGFKQILLGVHGHYRNPRAHSSRIDNTEVLPDFYDAMSLFSYVHRRLDTASRTPLT